MGNFHKKTKIITTLGPASDSQEMILKLSQSGMDVCRINASHGNHQAHLNAITNIRAINTKHKLNIGILMDLQGPKIRIGDIDGGKIMISVGQILTFTTDKIMGTAEKISINYAEFPKDVNPGEIILLDDGKLQCQIISTDKTKEVTAKVTVGGALSGKKGVNLPQTIISLPSLTPKDYEDLNFAISNNIEWIGLSFVRRPEDIIQLRKYLTLKNSTARIVAKIEMPEALLNIDEIIALSDAIMVARGDLGVEMPLEEVPMIQKSITQKCIAVAKPVIIATQMLESMLTNPRPTRAEANDVANSVLDGADAVMLSGETSVGEFAIEAVEVMNNIIKNVEEKGYNYNLHNAPLKTSKSYLNDSLCYNACTLADQTDAKALLAMTNSGYTAYQLSSHRPSAATYIFTGNTVLLNTLSLIWGVHAFYYNEFRSTDDTITDVNAIVTRLKLINKGDVVINICSTPIEKKQRTNMLKVSIIE